jgi:Copper transport outer membrane protein, MctB
VVDFRYHAMSLVAVFLALGIGIVLGVTVGDSVVSDADRNLRDSLRGDVEEARQQARDEEALGERRDDVIEEIAPQLAAKRLDGRRVALVALGELPAELAESVDEAVEMGGGRVVRTAELEPLPDADRARAQRRWGVTATRAVQSGGALLRRLARSTTPRWFSGRASGPVDGIVVYRHPPPEDESDEDAVLRDALADGVVRRIADTGIAVEALGTDPSQVEWYGERFTASVDNVDAVAGRLALVLVIADRRHEGSFGYKETAERPLPDLSD